MGYKNVRLPFGLRCSPCLLMIALYHILVLNTEGDSEEVRDLNGLLYQLFYMDNGAVAFEDSLKLQWAFDSLDSIFESFKFSLQQYVTNDLVYRSTLIEIWIGLLQLQ